MRIKIGENEYGVPFVFRSRGEAHNENYNDWCADGNGFEVETEDIVSALNELAQLRQERDSLQKRVEELEKLLNAKLLFVHAGERESDSKSERYYNPFIEKPKESPDEAVVEREHKKARE